MKKRVFSLILVIAMLGALIVGCQETDSTTSLTTTTAATTTKATTKASTTATTADENMSDIEGMTAPGILPIVTEPITLTLSFAMAANVTNYDENKFTLWLEEQTGINIEFDFLSSTETSQQFELMVSANEPLPDIVSLGLTDAVINSYGDNGVFLDLIDFFDKYGFFYYESLAKLEEMEQNNLETFGKSPNGNQYGFPRFQEGTNAKMAQFAIINQAWIDTLGLQHPATTDELYDVLTAFRDNDPNGNGKTDEIPSIGYKGYKSDLVINLVNSFVYYDPTGFNVENGVVSVPYNKDEYRTALKYVNKLVSEELVSPLTFTITQDEIKAMLSLEDGQDSFVGLVAGVNVLLFNSGNEKLYEYKAFQPITGPTGISYAPHLPSVIQYNSFITKDSEHPEIAFRLLDFMFAEYPSLLMRWGIEGEDWEYADKGEETFIADMPAYYRCPNLIWGQPQNQNWNTQFANFVPRYVIDGNVKQGDDPWQIHRQYQIFDYSSARLGDHPDEIIVKLIYTDEELNQRAEIASTINTYVEECRALFCTGGMDLDKDWDMYLSELDRIGLDVVISTAQSAYDRMNQ